MGERTRRLPKCMVGLGEGETILGRQLSHLQKSGFSEIVLTTGPYEEIIKDYCASLKLDMDIKFVFNPLYQETNYIYSIYLAKNFLMDDVLLLHGDLVFEEEVLEQILQCRESCMAISCEAPLPEKDFKAVLEGNRIKRIGLSYFMDAAAAQPLYNLKKKDWLIWLSEIEHFCKEGECSCYAEEAFNKVSESCCLYGFDVGMKLCTEIDTEMDLKNVKERLGRE